MDYASSNVSYEWYTEDTWSACNCVAGAQQTRSFTTICRERSSHNPAPGMCAESEKPVDTRNCAAFCWGAPVIPACPSGCGQAATTVTGTVDCTENTTKTVPESLCFASAKPDVTRSCPATGSCYSGSSGGGSSSSSSGGAYRDTDGDGQGDTFISGGCNGCSEFRGGQIDRTGSMVTGGSDDNWRNGSNGGSSSSSSSSSSSGGTSNDGIACNVIYTHFFRKGKMTRAQWKAVYLHSINNIPRATIRGYHFWAIPCVKLMRKYPIVESIVYPIMMARAEEIYYQMGLRDKPYYPGKLARLVLESISFVIGLFVPEQDYSVLYKNSKRAIPN
jgi:hypothetical protein